MKDPIISITVGNLATALEKDPYLKKKLSEKRAGDWAKEFAIMILERTWKSAVLPCQIEIVGDTKRLTVQKQFLQQFNKDLLLLRMSILGHRHATPIKQDSASWKNLISLWVDMEDTFELIGPSKFGVNPLAFGKTYLTHALEIVKTRKKFHIKSLLADDVRQQIADNIRLDLEIRTKKKEVERMFELFCELTDRQPVTIRSIQNLHKFLQAVKVLEENKAEDQWETWVQAQCFYYLDHFGEESNLGTELGYICGPESMARFTDFKRNLAALPEKKVPKATFKLPNLRSTF